MAENQRAEITPVRLAEIQQEIQSLEMLLSSRSNRYELGLQRRITTRKDELGV